MGLFRRKPRQFDTGFLARKVDAYQLTREKLDKLSGTGVMETEIVAHTWMLDVAEQVGGELWIGLGAYHLVRDGLSVGGCSQVGSNRPWLAVYWDGEDYQHCGMYDLAIEAFRQAASRVGKSRRE